MSYKSNPVVDNVIALRLLTILCTPFTEFPAYKAGIIDSKGKYIIPKSERTSQQNKSLTYLDRLMINLKKIINKLPGGENRLKNIVAAMVLIKEAYQNNTPEQLITEAKVIDAVNKVNTTDPQYRYVIDLWCEYLKNKQQNEQVGVGAISGGGQPNVPANNTSGIAITSLPLSQNAIFRRKDYKQCRQKLL